MSRSTVVLVLAAVAVVIVFGAARGQEYTLATPTLTATAGDGEILLSWSEVEGATRYDLWVQDCENAWSRIGEDDWRSTEAAHVDPVDGRRYQYTVQALNDQGEASDWASRSESGYVWVEATLNPIPFPEFEAVSQDGHIQLAVSAVDEAAGYEARVWYVGAGDQWLPLPEPDPETRTFSYFDVEPGVEYFFLMRSYSENRCGYSNWSAYVRHTFAGGGTTGGEGGTGGGPDGGTTGGESGEATSTATATSAGTPVPTGTRSPDGGTTDGDGDGVTGAANTATHTPTATATATSTGTPTGTPTPRPLPGRVSFTGTDSTHNSVTVYWNVPDPSAVEYVLRGGPYSGPKADIYTGSGTQYTWPGLDANTRYQFYIYGRNSPAFPDWGPWSYTISAWTKVAPSQLANYVPGAPTNLTAENDLVAKGISLSWSASTRMQPSDCACQTYEHKIMRRRANPERLWHVIATTSRSTTYTDRSARPGVQYEYQVRAVNRHGQSQPSNSASAAYVPHTPTPTPTPTPIPPTATPTPDPCAGVNCNTNYCSTFYCSPAQMRCCQTSDCECFCLDGPKMLELEFTSHRILHAKMQKKERAYQRMFYTHPYYALHEHHAQHEHK